MKLLICVLVSLVFLAPLRLVSVPWPSGLIAGLGVLVVWMASWKYIRIAACTIKRDLMYASILLCTSYSCSS